ncbi:hypothetical protein CLV28_2681 [Sediminihabitans luteus]|uniref:DUF1269 domain-containing protein n=1 Tax=Sediminihabitans luteus TaxID=1138585 RepID=A0A2M9CD01_9CELL|nr:DUF6325 family protein [Sediminihabitans luteus]PJJ69218.1 hypothetical protein CLV28_2681 [Sediminihabitans luteus]GII98894.1 hypothetical protein Slu03_12720 [Sediminihabitans luteus]
MSAEAGFGPVEFIVVGLPGGGVPDAVTAEIRRLVEADVVDLLDVAYVSASVDGELTTKELEDLEEYPALAEVGLDMPGLAGEEDLQEVAESLEPGTSALVLVVEHTWSRGFVGAVTASGAAVLQSTRIPADVVNEVAALAGAENEGEGR